MKKGSDTLHFAYDASGTPMTVTHNGTVYYYVTNLQGDVVKLVDSTGTTVATYSYDAWGNPLGTVPTSGVGYLNPLRYRGYVYDPETGFYYLQSRYYNPQTGRFLNADGLVSTGQGILGNNMFAYCVNNPINLSDPFGDEPLTMTLSGAAIVLEILTALFIVVAVVCIGYYAIDIAMDIVNDVIDFAKAGDGIKEHTNGNKRWDKHTKKRPGDKEKGDSRRTNRINKKKRNLKPGSNYRFKEERLK